MSPTAAKSINRLRMKDHDLANPASYTEPQLLCDLIMKGGITSGVVYPDAVCRLATRYRPKAAWRGLRRGDRCGFRRCR
jgi:hypothetical protein